MSKKLSSPSLYRPVICHKQVGSLVLTGDRASFHSDNNEVVVEMPWSRIVKVKANVATSASALLRIQLSKDGNDKVNDDNETVVLKFQDRLELENARRDMNARRATADHQVVGDDADHATFVSELPPKVVTTKRGSGMRRAASEQDVRVTNGTEKKSQSKRSRRRTGVAEQRRPSYLGAYRDHDAMTEDHHDHVEEEESMVMSEIVDHQRRRNVTPPPTTTPPRTISDAARRQRHSVHEANEADVNYIMGYQHATGAVATVGGLHTPTNNGNVMLDHSYNTAPLPQRRATTLGMGGMTREMAALPMVDQSFNTIATAPPVMSNSCNSNIAVSNLQDKVVVNRFTDSGRETRVVVDFAQFDKTKTILVSSTRAIDVAGNQQAGGKGDDDVDNNNRADGAPSRGMKKSASVPARRMKSHREFDEEEDDDGYEQDRRRSKRRYSSSRRSNPSYNDWPPPPHPEVVAVPAAASVEQTRNKDSDNGNSPTCFGCAVSVGCCAGVWCVICLCFLCCVVIPAVVTVIVLLKPFAFQKTEEPATADNGDNFYDDQVQPTDAAANLYHPTRRLFLRHC